jgi:hypothetical protein
MSARSGQKTRTASRSTQSITPRDCTPRKDEDRLIAKRIADVEQRVGGFWTTLTSSLRISWFIIALVIGALAAYFGPKILGALFP